jgi:hypothetical protein
MDLCLTLVIDSKLCYDHASSFYDASGALSKSLSRQPARGRKVPVPVKYDLADVRLNPKNFPRNSDAVARVPTAFCFSAPSASIKTSHDTR